MTDQYQQEQHDRAVAQIVGQQPEPTALLSESDLKRFRGATWHVPSIGLTPAMRNLEKGRTVEDVAIGFLAIGEAYGDALRRIDDLREEVRRLNAERDTVRAYFGVAKES